jgi:hypothetical protein
MDGATLGWIGGILGSVIGILGGVVGTYFSIRNAKPGSQRRFMIQAATAMWVVMVLLGAAILLAVLGTLPFWTLWAAQGIFFAGLGPAIVLVNRRCRALEGEDRIWESSGEGR